MREDEDGASCLFVRNASGSRIQFKSAEAVLTHRRVRGCVEKVNEHEFFWVSGEIVRIGIDKTLLARKVCPEKCFSDI
jgi:hypothetical protein